jgi:glycosyltransferase involved in cell wall biosynthesis
MKIAAVGDSTKPGTYGGIPYHLWQAGIDCGLPFDGLRLDTAAPVWRRRRFMWNLRQVAAGKGAGGYQYSDEFLEALWQQESPPQSEDGLLNLFQLFPKTIVGRGLNKSWFYIDQTLTQLFDYYEMGRSAPRRLRDDAIARETEQYQQSAGVLCFSQWAARELQDTYKIPAQKIHIAIAGANLDARAVEKWNGIPHLSKRDGKPLRLVFVGKEWKRKGLDRLLRAMKIVRSRNVAAELVVIGVAQRSLPPELALTKGVTWIGFVDKGREAGRFIRLVSGCDVGCLLSVAETAGISLKEFARLGLPVIAPRTGGAPEYVVPGASNLVATGDTDEEIAEIICSLASNRNLLSQQQALAWQARAEAGWDRTVEKIARVVGMNRGGSPCDAGGTGRKASVPSRDGQVAAARQIFGGVAH